MMLLRLVLLLCLLLASASAMDIYVSPTGNDSNSGTATDPLQTISAAVYAASAGSTIFLGAGTYSEAAPISVSNPLQFTTTSGLPDAFVTTGGSNILQLSSAQVGFNQVIFGPALLCIDMESVSLNLSSSSFFHCDTAIQSVNSTMTATDSSFAYSGGAAVSLSGGSANFDRCSFSATIGSSSGVLYVDFNTSVKLSDTQFFENGDLGFQSLGVVVNHGELVVDKCQFMQNMAISGGAIASSGTASITQSSFSSNSANSCGAIDNSGMMTIDNSSFFENAGLPMTGVLCNEQSSTMRVLSSSFTFNNATSESVISNYGSMEVIDSDFSSNIVIDGAGPIANYGSMSVSGCTFTANNGTYGGAVASQGPELNVSNCKFTSNNAAFGGAIFSQTMSFSLVASTLTSNSAGLGGAVYLTSSDASVSNCTISNNWAVSNGGALYFDPDSLFNSTSVWNACTFSCNCASPGGSTFYVGSGSQFLVDCNVTACPGVALSEQVGGLLTFIGGMSDKANCPAH